MQNVGGDREEDVAEWESLPEWMENRLEASIATGLVKRVGVVIC